jgi:hypothetical protein
MSFSIHSLTSGSHVSFPSSFLSFSILLLSSCSGCRPASLQQRAQGLQQRRFRNPLEVLRPALTLLQPDGHSQTQSWLLVAVHRSSSWSSPPPPSWSPAAGSRPSPQYATRSGSTSLSSSGRTAIVPVRDLGSHRAATTLGRRSSGLVPCHCCLGAALVPAGLFARRSRTSSARKRISGDGVELGHRRRRSGERGCCKRCGAAAGEGCGTATGSHDRQRPLAPFWSSISLPPPRLNDLAGWPHAGPTAGRTSNTARVFFTDR